MVDLRDIDDYLDPNYYDNIDYYSKLCRQSSKLDVTNPLNIRCPCGGYLKRVLGDERFLRYFQARCENPKCEHPPVKKGGCYNLCSDCDHYSVNLDGICVVCTEFTTSVPKWDHGLNVEPQEQEDYDTYLVRERRWRKLQYFMYCVGCFALAKKSKQSKKRKRVTFFSDSDDNSDDKKTVHKKKYPKEQHLNGLMENL